MGNLQRLLDALLQHLPKGADRKTVRAALNEAAEALPDSQVKTRLRLQRSLPKYADQLLEQLKSQEDDEGAEALAEEESVPAPEQGPAELEAHTRAAAAYSDVDPSDLQACVARCARLLQKAIATLRRSRWAEEALRGLLAMCPLKDFGRTPGKCDAALLQSCVQLAPTAAMLLGASRHELRTWKVFLGFLVAGLATVQDGNGKAAATSSRAVELGQKVAGVVVLLSTPRTVRGAMGLAMASVHGSVTPMGFEGLAAAILPLVTAAFDADALGCGEPLMRGDLASLLHALQLVHTCKTAGIGDVRALDEAHLTLGLSLEHHFDVAPMLEELAPLAEGVKGPRGKTVRRQVEQSGRMSRPQAAMLLLEIFAVAAAQISPEIMRRLKERSSLPVDGEDSLELDPRAALARAQGELFFEDTMGTAPGDTDDPVGLSTGVVAAATAAIREQSFGVIEGLEGLHGGVSLDDDAQQAADEAKPRSKKKRKLGSRGKQLQGAKQLEGGLPQEVAEEEAAEEDEEDLAGSGEPVRRRRRRKSQAG